MLIYSCLSIFLSMVWCHPWSEGGRLCVVWRPWLCSTCSADRTPSYRSVRQLCQLHTRKHFTWNIKQKTMHTWNKYEETRKIYHVHLDLLGVKFSTWSGGRGRGDDWRRYLATGKMQQCNADDFGLSQPAVSRVSQTLEALTSPHLIRRFIKFQPIPGIFKDRRRDSMPLQASLV